MKILFSITLFLISQSIFSQNKLPDSTHKIPFDINKIKNATRLSNTSEAFSYDSLYIWNDKRSLSEIMDERPGYFIFDFGLGGRNDINYNSNYSREVGIFRDGIQINDNFFQGFDIQNISVNEIDKIEEVSNISSFFYGINSFAKGINVITKDIFQSKPFSQLRFSQDRFGSLFADVFLSQPLSRKRNVQLGLTKHSLDGRYDNSNFNIWRGRARINLFFSPKFNAKMNFYLNNYDRGLNDGLIYSSNKDSLTDPNLATVIHPSTSEHLENYYYDLTLTGKFFKDKNSLTYFKLYSNNSLRNLINPDSSFFSNYPPGHNHSLLYGLDISQNIFINHNKFTSSDIFFGGNVYLNLFSGSYIKNRQDNYYSFKARYNFNYKNVFISALLRNDNIFKKNYLNAGIEAVLKIFNKKQFLFEISGGINQTKYLLRNDAYALISNYRSILEIPRQIYEMGSKIKYNNFTLSGVFYGINYDSVYSKRYGINSSLMFNSRYSDITINFDYSSDKLFPEYYIKSDIAYKNILFNGKLRLKTGFNIKYYQINFITKHFQTWYSFDYTNETFPQKNQFIADFYVGARIGHANINLTIVNIFNSLVYNTYLFPLDNRGGFLNSISRFTIVWDFIN